MTISFFLGALLGAPWVFSFAPLSLWWLGLILVTALPFCALHVGQNETCSKRCFKQAFLMGLGFGWFAYGLGVSWLFVSLHTYGGLAAWFAVFSVALFALYLALFPALAVWAYSRLAMRHHSWFSALNNGLLWAGLWTFFEWLRGTFLTGFAWLGLGDALVDSPFGNLLPWLGSHGALFMVMVLAHLAVSACLHRTTRNWATVLVFAAFVVVLVQIPVQTRSAGVLSVVGVQTNVDQSIKFDPDLINSNMEKAFDLGDLAKASMPRGGLLVFPETVNPLVWTDTPQEWRERFRDFAKPDHTRVILGSAVEDGARFYNSIVMFNGNERGQDLLVPKQRHDKRHLVPFGEFVPFGFHWFVALLNMPMGEFTSGEGGLQPFHVQNNFLASTVCYEDIFGGEFARLLNQSFQEPTAFVNLSNLAWFGQSWALEQHAQIGRTRSAEHRKPGLRVTNTGLSGIVNEKGQWLERVKPGHAVVWAGQLEGRLGQTFFAKWGSFVWFGIWGVLLLLLCMREGYLRAYNRGR